MLQARGHLRIFVNSPQSILYCNFLLGLPKKAGSHLGSASSPREADKKYKSCSPLLEITIYVAVPIYLKEMSLKKNSKILKGYCTVSSLFQEMLLI